MNKPLTAFLVAVILLPNVPAATIFVNGLAIPGGTGDAFGTSVNDGRLGFFSDIYYDQLRNEWWALSDRGPGGGTLSYDTARNASLSISTRRPEQYPTSKSPGR